MPGRLEGRVSMPKTGINGSPSTRNNPRSPPGQEAVLSSGSKASTTSGEGPSLEAGLGPEEGEGYQKLMTMTNPAPTMK